MFMDIVHYYMYNYLRDNIGKVKSRNCVTLDSGSLFGICVPPDCPHVSPRVTRIDIDGITTVIMSIEGRALVIYQHADKQQYLSELNYTLKAVA